jgi:hypothetical protein
MHTGNGVSTVVDIHGADEPMTMSAIQPLLTDIQHRLGNQLPIYYPFTPPSGDPSQITKSNYLALIKNPTCLSDCLNFYGKLNTPSKDAWQAVPILIAAWEGEGSQNAATKQQYLDGAVNAVANTCAGLTQDFLPLTDPPLDYYWWGKFWAYTYDAILHTQGTPEYDIMMSQFWTTLGQVADAWPIMNISGTVADGVAMGTIAAAFWYDGAFRHQDVYNYQLSNAAKFQRFANGIWNAYQTYNDIEDDDQFYGTASLFILEAWWRLRGEYTAQELYCHFADQIANDGSYPAYGDGGAPGQYFIALLCAELAATRTKDGLLKSGYKQLAHRAFWNGHDRLLSLRGGSYLNEVYTALAYLHADDTIAEDDLPAGVKLSVRQWRDLTPVEMRLAGWRWFTFQPRKAPNKLIFRAGSSPTDASLVMQVGQLGGHGHMDAGAITYYGSDHASYFDYATLRLDRYQEAHNIFTLRADQGVLWCGRLNNGTPPVDDPCFTTEEVLVPTMGTTSDASYARIQIIEYLASDLTRPYWWKLVKPEVWPKTWTLEKAIGYKNWPLRLNRSVLFVNNKFTVVRDEPNFLIPVLAQMGPNWTFGELGCAGTHWVNVWMPKVLNAFYGGVTYDQNSQLHHLKWISTAPKDLLIWFSPESGNVLQIERLNGDRTLSPDYVPLNPAPNTSSNSYINLPMRAWYTRTDKWPQGVQKAFATVLMPHDPMSLDDLQSLVQRINSIEEKDEVTVLTITDDTHVYLVVMQSSGGNTINVEATLPVSEQLIKLITDGEATLITCNYDGTPAHVSAWGASSLSIDGDVYLQSSTPMPEWEA